MKKLPILFLISISLNRAGYLTKFCPYISYPANSYVITKRFCRMVITKRRIIFNPRKNKKRTPKVRFYAFKSIKKQPT